eukprot:TRINITY_DN15437_c0_g1_i1.p1 TRINITY_DN15437_c0_g1~~TRINITY_DN15437_c0_g1_i1.p1  ORF type:complete len:343 (+),score=32.66 TRINITY_DN15437_c0_g1_i1:17-1045(+)
MQDEMDDTQHETECVECSEAGTHICEDCDLAILCVECVAHHQRAKRTRCHSVVLISDAPTTMLSLLASNRSKSISRDSTEPLQLKETPMCVVHVRERADVCCVTCTEVVCKLCIFSPSHAKHEFQPLVDQLPRLLENLRQIISGLKEISGSVSQQLHASNSELEGLKSDYRKKLTQLRREHDSRAKPLEACISSLEMVQLTIDRGLPQVEQMLDRNAISKALSNQRLLQHTPAVAVAAGTRPTKDGPRSSSSPDSSTEPLPSPSNSDEPTQQLQQLPVIPPMMWSVVNKSQSLWVQPNNEIMHIGRENLHATVWGEKPLPKRGGVLRFNFTLRPATPEGFAR